MADRFRLTLAQLNPTVGALAENAAKARAAWDQARSAGADMLALPEMFISGYQAQDLLARPEFVADCARVIETLARDCTDGPAIGIGGPYRDGDHLHNAYWVLAGGKVQTIVRKHHLPNGGVFDELRLFSSAPINGPYRIGPVRIGSPICEDAWHPDVAESLAESGAEILLVPNGSPYARGKFDRRLSHMVARVVETGLPLVYLNMVGGQDDQIFDGGSFILNPRGEMAAKLPAFDEAITHADFEQGPDGWRALPGAFVATSDDFAQDYHAMVLGLRDYVNKSGFHKVLLGLSGGIDSALVAVIAADALGADNLHCVMLPSAYTSQGSLADAADIAARLGCRLDSLPITGPQAAVNDTLAPLFAGLAPDLTEENIQSRLRAVLLMALSNKFGAMLLTTGNKSEVAVGYSTIYGDMAGGYNPIKDLYKTRVFDICRWRNANHHPWMRGPAGELIAPRIIDKPPSAELRENQRDDDSLPPYPVLDAILEQLIDKDASVAEIVAMGHPRDMVKRIEKLIYQSEYKRFQAAPGARLSTRGFGPDRRYPIVNRWRDES